MVIYLFVKCSCSTKFCLNSANLICRGIDNSKYFRESLRLRDNESRLYITLYTIVFTIYILLGNMGVYRFVNAMSDCMGNQTEIYGSSLSTTPTAESLFLKVRSISQHCLHLITRTILILFVPFRLFCESSQNARQPIPFSNFLKTYVSVWVTFDCILELFEYITKSTGHLISL